MNIRKSACLATVLLSLGLQTSARAADSTSAESAGFHLPVGLGFSSGHLDVSDAIQNLYRAAGWQVHDAVTVPIGLSFSPYYEFGFGLGLGLSLGPTAFFEVHEQPYGGRPAGPPGETDQNKFSYIIPVGADIRYTFLRDRVVSPYAKVGIRYPIAGGDNLSGSSEPGPYGGVGVELFRTQRIAFGVEFGYDASRVSVRGPSSFGGTSKVTYSGFTGSLFVIF